MYVVSSANAWLARSIFMPRSRYAPDLVPSVAPARVRLAVQRLDAHARHQPAHAATANLVAIPAHQSLICFAHRLGLVVHTRSGNSHKPGLPRYRQGMVTANDFFALGNPALSSAPLRGQFKNSREGLFTSSASC
ncbi:hypothetical protein [Burkholderia glumae]|uniref:hypothetical protein n=1 Tax=Burkholderia glumae TaxID=337 RepID=UPI000F5D6CFC|nr:hypothetical protein [Burkholderia glumae]MCQ0029332.1 hypothetical protein [Burkholderia glumae]MCQ0036921.1 hypothetical protein [Burkholderia glumae]